MTHWTHPHKLALAAVSLALVLPACDWMPGKPDPADRWQPADQIVDFKHLYNENCRGCHGIDGTVAGSNSLDQPTYLAFIGEESLRTVITEGVSASNMPAFSQDHGGPLTAAQIDALVKGLMNQKHEVPGPLPPYEAALGDPIAGRETFGISCAGCHGADGKGIPGKAGSVVDSAYLGLVSNQYLRTMTVAGRPELGCPDFFHRTPGKVMTDQEVSDVTAWLVSNRRGEFGQPKPINQR